MMAISDRAEQNGFFGITLPRICIAWPSMSVQARRPARVASKPCLKRADLEELFHSELADAALPRRARHAQHATA